MTHAHPHSHVLPLNRRGVLFGAAGLSLAYAGRAFADSAPGTRNKTVVVIARGAMDGLSVTVPYGDANYRPLRGGLTIGAPGEANGALDLAEGFGLHPALAGLHGLNGVGQLRFAPAVAIPARIRSHFDAQDVLEAAGPAGASMMDG